MTEAKVKITVKNGKITTDYYGNEAQGTNAIAVSLAKQLALLVMGGALTEEEAEDGLRRLKERYQRFLMQMRWEEIRDE